MQISKHQDGMYRIHDQDCVVAVVVELPDARLFAAAPDLYRVALALKLWGGGTLRDPNDLEAIVDLAKTTVGQVNGT